jgi:TonB family protein
MKNLIIFFLVIFSFSVFGQKEYFPNYKTAENAGGKAEFHRIFRQEVIYPKKSLIAGTGGRVTYKFKVAKDGSVSDFSKVESVNNELNQEALRLIKFMKWSPAENGNEKLDSYVEFSVNFEPKKYNSICKKRGYQYVGYPHNPVDTSFVIYEKVDQAPKFKMKEDDLSDFFRKNLRYPKEAMIREIKGTVMVSFIVEPSGMVTNIKIEKGVGAGCSEEAYRLVSLTRWSPAIKEGVAVRYMKKLPITFDMSKSMGDGINREQRTF